jgi:molecular chaperone IbpA|tara:strand:+ start:1208 stop:1666 length:459 start_codon:yes stop_codon:yes gene_type:complete
MKNNLSIFNNLRPLTVGFDDMFAHFEHMMDDRFITNGTVSNFPPYNIVKTGKNTYNIELALAGFNKKDIDVEYEDNNLVVKSKKVDKAEASETTDVDGNMIHRGISKRHFLKSFTIASDVEVKGAELKDGLLTVALERIIPDAKKARSIEIK